MVYISIYRLLVSVVRRDQPPTVLLRDWIQGPTTVYKEIFSDPHIDSE
jgi:hypothetical protein